MGTKRTFISILIFGVFLALSQQNLFNASLSYAKDPITLRAVSFLPPPVAAMEWMKRWVKGVNEQARGELTINWLGGPEVIPPPAQAEAVRTGAIDVLIHTPGAYASAIPVMPYIGLSGYSIQEERQPKSGFYDWMVDIHKKRMNTYFIGRAEANVEFVIWLRKGIERPQDLAGLKGGGAPWMLSFFKALGVAPVNVATRERYSALERGVIDAGIVPLDTGSDLSYQDVAPFVIDHGFWRSGNIVLLVNLDKWNSLPKRLQDIMLDVQMKLEPQMVEWRGGRLANAKKKLAGAIKFIQFSEDDAKYYVDLAYSSAWGDAKQRLSPEDYNHLRKTFIKGGQ